MTFTEQINAIIDRRKGRNGYEGKGHLQVITKKKEFFEVLNRLMDEYAVLRKNILSQIKEQKGEYYVMSIEDPTFYDKVDLTDPSSIILQLQQCQKECERLEKRFNRDTINISVVGRARQGKSRLLQSISGLSNNVIPASNGGDCTGAKSIIVNAESKTYAKVIFYNELELIEQIQKYLDAVGIERNISSINQIKSLQQDVYAMSEHLNEKTGKQQSRYQHLKKYVEHFDDYACYIGSTKDDIKEEDIRTYVAQYDADMKPTYTFLAVKEVAIYTHFPVKDAGKLVLVDTIGLGDTSLGIREKMIRTLREDSDAAILVRLPSANGDGIRVEDDELYDLICEAMGAEALNKWLFFALNVADELGNHNSGVSMEQALRDRKLNYAFVHKVDCGDAKAVEHDLLLPILEYLITNLSTVDNNLMCTANDLFEETFQIYFDFCAKMQNVLSGGFKKSLDGGGLFDELYEDQLELARQIDELSKKYSGRNLECSKIKEEVMKVIHSIASYCPTAEEIHHRLTAGGPDAYPNNVYNYYADNLRARVRDQFEEINHSTITELQEEFKQEICSILRDETGGRLQYIPLQAEIAEGDSVQWLQALIDEKLNNYPLIAEAFMDICNYRLNIEGLLEYKANRALECLDPSPQNEQYVQPQFQGKSIDEIVETIEQTLMSTIPVVADEMMEGIKELLVIPYNSFNARIRKLKDRIIFKTEGRRELKNFYRENAPAIWQKEFKNIAGKEIALGQLNDYNEKIIAQRNKKLFILTLV